MTTLLELCSSTSELPCATYLHMSRPSTCRRIHPSFFSCRRSPYTASRESPAQRSGQAYPAHLCALLGHCSHYLCALLRHCCLTLSTECHCFCTGTTAARQVCSKHPLIKSLFAESLIDVLVNRCTATTALLQLLSDTARPRLTKPPLRVSGANGSATPFCFSAGVRLRLQIPHSQDVPGLF